MTTYLTTDFINSFRDGERTLDFGGRSLTIRHSTARSGLISAELEILEGTSILGYITSYGDNEHGAIAAHLFGHAGAPRLFRELEPALREILAAQPNR